MVDHEVNRDQWIDFQRIAAKFLHRGAHTRQVHDGGNAREILQDDSGQLERNLDLERLRGVVPSEIFDIGFGHVVAVAIAQHALEHHADADGELVHFEAQLLEFTQAVVVKRFAADREGVACAEGVARQFWHG